MKRLAFAVGLNVGVFFISAIALTSQWQALGAVLCLFSYPSIFFLGWTWSKNPIKISVTPSNTKINDMNTAPKRRKSRLNEMPQ